jgi:hyaluronan synthase
MYKYLLLIIEFITAIYLFYLSFTDNISFQLSFYGTLLIGYLFIQLLFSYLNHKENLTNFKSYDAKSVLLIVGYQERVDYWTKCLTSVIQQKKNTRLYRVYIVIDGDTPSDLYMKNIAENILCDQNNELPFECYIYMISHRGKRGALFFGINQITKDFYFIRENIDVIVTDSDTIIDPSSLNFLQNCLRSNDNNGCVTGSLYIFNQEDGLLPKMINARYQYAFQIERGASSYMNCMTCCSGPISIYRLDCLNELIVKKFITQSFLNVKCEPGDDRHLTNLILMLGKNAKQTSLATAGTEAPETLFRFLKQQLRWSRSFYRELYWQIKSIPQQSIYLGIITVYELLFPYLVTFWIIYNLYFESSMNNLLKNLYISIGILILRTFILITYTKDIKMLYNIIYYPVYLFLLLPTKIFAFLTLLNNTWETQSRNNIFIQCFNYISFHFCFIFFWNVMLFYPIIHYLIKILY